LIRCAAVAAFRRGRRKKKQRQNIYVLYSFQEFSNPGTYHVMSVQAFTRTQHITPRCSSLLLHPVAPRKRHRSRGSRFPVGLSSQLHKFAQTLEHTAQTMHDRNADPFSESVKAAFSSVEHHGTVHLFYERQDHRPVFIDPYTLVDIDPLELALH
jgi:hypothetical protein